MLLLVASRVGNEHIRTQAHSCGRTSAKLQFPLWSPLAPLGAARRTNLRGQESALRTTLSFAGHVAVLAAALAAAGCARACDLTAFATSGWSLGKLKSTARTIAETHNSANTATHKRMKTAPHRDRQTDRQTDRRTHTHTRTHARTQASTHEHIHTPQQTRDTSKLPGQPPRLGVLAAAGFLRAAIAAAGRFTGLAGNGATSCFADGHCVASKQAQGTRQSGSVERRSGKRYTGLSTCLSGFSSAASAACQLFHGILGGALVERLDTPMLKQFLDAFLCK